MAARSAIATSGSGSWPTPTEDRICCVPDRLPYRHTVCPVAVVERATCPGPWFPGCASPRMSRTGLTANGGGRNVPQSIDLHGRNFALAAANPLHAQKPAATTPTKPRRHRRGATAPVRADLGSRDCGSRSLSRRSQHRHRRSARGAARHWDPRIGEDHPGPYHEDYSGEMRILPAATYAKINGDRRAALGRPLNGRWGESTWALPEERETPACGQAWWQAIPGKRWDLRYRPGRAPSNAES